MLDWPIYLIIIIIPTARSARSLTFGTLKELCEQSEARLVLNFLPNNL